MELIIEKPAISFDLDKIKRGYLLWAKHSSWAEGKAGFVTAATESQLVVQYYPGIGNVTNHFRILVSEAAAGQWEIRWSADMSEIDQYGVTEDNEMPELKEPEASAGGESPEDQKGAVAAEAEGTCCQENTGQSEAAEGRGKQ